MYIVYLPHTDTDPFAPTDYSGMPTTGIANSSPGHAHTEITHQIGWVNKFDHCISFTCHDLGIDILTLTCKEIVLSANFIFLKTILHLTHRYRAYKPPIVRCVGICCLCRKCHNGEHVNHLPLVSALIYCHIRQRDRY